MFICLVRKQLITDAAFKTVASFILPRLHHCTSVLCCLVHLLSTASSVAGTLQPDLSCENRNVFTLLLCFGPYSCYPCLGEFRTKLTTSATNYQRLPTLLPLWPPPYIYTAACLLRLAVAFKFFLFEYIDVDTPQSVAILFLFLVLSQFHKHRLSPLSRLNSKPIPSPNSNHSSPPLLFFR